MGALKAMYLTSTFIGFVAGITDVIFYKMLRKLAQWF